jgi:hypothetical protein
MSERDWAQRHIDTFRFHRGHSMCAVKGCTGSQPLMWVPTADEDGEVAALEAEVIVLAKQAEIALENVQRRNEGTPSPWARGSDHIHWAGGPRA